MWTRWRLWLASVLRRERFDHDVTDELRFHLQARAEYWRRQGLSPRAAERRARLEFGSVERAREQVRDIRMGLWFEQLRQDLRHGVRVLIARPVFTAAAVLTLALGIGATATVFSLLDVALLRPLPVLNSSELAHVYTSCRRGDPYCASSYPEFLDYRSQNRSFVDMAAFVGRNVSVGSDAGRWAGSGLLISMNYFSLLGVAPHVGRLISPGGDPTADPSVVLGYGAWQTRFGGDPGIVGDTVRVGGSAFRVIGVTPPGFQGTRLDVNPDLWIPIDNVSLLPGLREDQLANRGARWISGTVARLRPGISIVQAGVEMSLISEGLQASDPSRAQRFITVEAANRAALPPSAAADITRFVALLMGAVGATLFIACANVAGLLLARGAARRHELELRLALGAGRGRIVRQLLTESLLLAVVGTAGGLLVARWAMDFLATYDLPGGVTVASLGLGLDVRVLTFASMLLVATALFGLLPALGATRHIAPTMAARITGDGIGNLRGQSTLLGAQVTVTIVLLLGAGLFIRSLQNGLELDLGVASGPVVLAEIAPGLEGYPPGRVRSVLDEATSRLAELSGVANASAAILPPLTGGNGFLADGIEGYVRGPDEEIRFESNFVKPDYFAALGIEIRAGREFTTSDREGTPLVAVISDTMARRYWEGRDPIGTRLSTGSLGEAIEIIGVARDVRVGLDGIAEPFVYLPLDQHPRFMAVPFPMVLIVRAESNPLPLAVPVRTVLADIDPTLPVTDVTTLDTRIAGLLMPQRLGSVLLSALAFLTVILVAVGVVGAVAYSVARRRSEIGIRLALGAQRSEVTRTMTFGALRPVATGLVIGVLAAVVLGRLISGFLYGVQPTDEVTLLGAVAVLSAVAGIAAYVPARRATSIDPAEVLIAE